VVTEYVSWKAGDPAIKADPQTIKPKTWTNLKFGSNGDVIVPKHDGQALWDAYVNIETAGGASQYKIRFIRDPKGIADFTGIASYGIAYEPQTHVHFFNAKKGQPVAVQIWHDGKSNMVVSTREFKMWIP
jgi:hypothetical protein